MASSGRNAWIKYFQGKGNLSTAMKKDSIVYDEENQSKAIGNIKAGTKVVYLAAKEYQTKALVEYESNKKKITGRVPFDNIAKPGVAASGSVSLKPQTFNVGETKYTFSTYRKTVLESIEENKRLNGNLKTYLFSLFDHYSGGSTSQQQVKNIFDNIKDEIPINDINKDFGEVLGPVAIIQKGLLKTKKILLDKGSVRIYVPSRPNEPLMDYGLIKDDIQYIISAKSGKTTNVVKPSDILSLLAKNPKKINKWKKTKEYILLQILSENSIMLGPIKGISMLHPELIDQDAINSISSPNKYDINKFKKFIDSNMYLKQKKMPTLNEIMYECEKMLQNETKNGPLKMNEIFSDAIENTVIYVKFQINMSSGVGDWDVIASDDIRKINEHGIVYLRTKNGYTRASDRMGIQV